jgi:hypothetical protein
MKKLLFWITLPFMMVLFAVASLIGSLCEGCAECCHRWEGWCLDYKTKYKGMYYKGDGIWSSFKDEL